MLDESIRHYLISNYGTYSYAQACKDFGITIEEIQHTLKEAGRSKKCSYSKRSYESKLEIAEYRKTHGITATAAYFCTSGDIVERVAKELDVTIPDRSAILETARIEHYGSLEQYKNEMTRKARQTSQERYGVDNYAKTSESKQKAKETSIRKYGVDNPMQSSSVKQKLNETNITKYGVPWGLANKDVIQKRIDTNNERWGGCGWASKEVRSKYEKTFYERYGSHHWNESEELKDKINKTCQQKHGVDWPCQYPEVKTMSNNSKPNQYFASLLDAKNISYIREFGLGRKSYDFKVENTLIEIDPTATHNSTWGVFNCPATPKTYHQDKTQLALSNGYRCIHVFDWDNAELIVNLLCDRERIYARKCTIRSVQKEQERKFLKDNHLQGYVKSDVCIGLYTGSTLVAIMSFGRPRYNNNFQYELLRYCSIKNIIGGAEKLFTHFICDYNPNSIISYCDLSKFTGSTYAKLGFKLQSINIAAHWYNMYTHTHFTDNLVRQRGVDQLLGTNYGKGTSNEEILVSLKFVKIYDAGQATYVWKSVE